MKSLFLNLTLLTMLLIVSFTEAKGQKLYIKPGIGYSAGVEKAYFNLQNYHTKIYEDTSLMSSSYHQEKFSYGKGLNYELIAGSRISDKFNIELSFFYHKSSEYELKQKESYEIVDAYDVDYNYKYNLTGTSYGLKPNVLYYFYKKSFSPYAKVGAIIAFNSLNEFVDLTIYNTIPGYMPIENIEYKFEYEKNLSLGYHLGGGFELKILEGFLFFTELHYSHLSYTAEKSEITEYTVHGKDALHELSTNERYIEYTDSFTSSENENENTPSKKYKGKDFFSQLGVLAGLKFHLL